MKKVISCILVLCMLLTAVAGLVGCNKEESTGSITVWGGINPSSTLPDIDQITAEYHALWEQYNPNAQIEWLDGDIKMLMASGDYPDVIMKSSFNTQEVSKYAAQGILLPLEEYINEKDTPNIWNMFQERPTTKAIATSPDGHIYGLPALTSREKDFVETYFYINKTWLDKLGLQIPTTLDELYEVLKAFKTQDPNGNGQADEIPMMFGNEMANSYPETLLSAWGVSTKFGIYDGWLNVIDGEVRFCPLLDEWKEMCKFYNKLWEEGLLDIESFTMESAQMYAKVQSSTPIVGVAFHGKPVFGENNDQYVSIKPLSADGKIKPVLHVYPGAIGSKNSAHITSSCENPKEAIKFLDGFYDKENTLINLYGQVGEDDTFSKKDGMLIWNEAPEGENELKLATDNTIWGPHMLGFIVEEDFGTLVEKPDFHAQNDEAFEVVADYVDKELWPRPSYTEEDSTRINELLTDITSYVEQMKTAFITGKVDIDEGWDEYIEHLYKIGAEEYLEINKRAYKIYYDAIKELEQD